MIKVKLCQILFQKFQAKKLSKISWIWSEYCLFMESLSVWESFSFDLKSVCWPAFFPSFRTAAFVSLWIGLSLYNIHYPCFGKRCINRKRPKWHSSLIDFLSHNPRGGITITVTTTIPTEQDDSKLWRVLLVREINFSTRQTHFKSKEYPRSGLTQHWTSNSNASKTFVLTKKNKENEAPAYSLLALSMLHRTKLESLDYVVGGEWWYEYIINDK